MNETVYVHHPCWLNTKTWNIFYYFLNKDKYSSFKILQDLFNFWFFVLFFSKPVKHKGFAELGFPVSWIIFLIDTKCHFFLPFSQKVPHSEHVESLEHWELKISSWIMLPECSSAGSSVLLMFPMVHIIFFIFLLVYSHCHQKPSFTLHSIVPTLIAWKYRKSCYFLFRKCLSLKVYIVKPHSSQQ